MVQQYPDQQSALDALKSGEIDLLTANQALANSHPDLLASAVYFNDHSVLVSQQSLTQPLDRGLSGKTLLYRVNGTLRAPLHAAYPQATSVASHDDYAAMSAVPESDDVTLWTNAVTTEEINSRIYNKRLVITPSEIEPELGVNFLAHNQALSHALSEERERAEQDNRAKSTFLATMRHEIRTPVSAIIGLLELAVNTGEQQPAADDPVRVAWRGNRPNH